MNLEKLIAEAWEQERERYERHMWFKEPEGWTTRLTNRDTKEALTFGSLTDCERHLSALCARAVMRAMAAANLEVCPRIPCDLSATMTALGCNLLPAAVEQP